MEAHPYYSELKSWLSAHPDTKKLKFLEVGSGRGALQDVVPDYTGLDYAGTVAGKYHKPFYSASASDMPFENNTFDVVWSFAVWEHIPEPEKAFEETVRVLKDGGHFLFCPAWHCRPWAAGGYQVRPYSDFGLGGKIYKFFIPFLNTTPMLMLRFLPVKIATLTDTRTGQPLRYRKLKANYEHFWQSDSDACNSLDPFPVIRWFTSRGHECVTYPSEKAQFLARHGTIEFIIHK